VQSVGASSPLSSVIYDDGNALAYHGGLVSYNGGHDRYAYNASLLDIMFFPPGKYNGRVPSKKHYQVVPFCNPITWRGHKTLTESLSPSRTGAILRSRSQADIRPSQVLSLNMLFNIRKSDNLLADGAAIVASGLWRLTRFRQNQVSGTVTCGRSNTASSL
jgi:hypothetical protein